MTQEYKLVPLDEPIEYDPNWTDSQSARRRELTCRKCGAFLSSHYTTYDRALACTFAPVREVERWVKV